MRDSTELYFLAFGAFITWTGSVVSLVIWLTGKFRSLESSMYRESNKLRQESNLKFEVNATKIQRLELKIFGFTPVSYERTNGEG